MTDERYDFVPREYWPRLGPAFQGIDRDLGAIHDDLAALVAGGGGGGVAVTWSTLSGKPTLAAVATSGAYADLTGRPAIPDVTTLAPKANPAFTGTVTFTGTTVTGLGIDASAIKTGTIPATRLGGGPRDATTVLHGDQMYRALSIGASQVASGVFATERLGTGTASGTTVLHGDGTWKTPAAGVGTDITVRQNEDGTWPTITRVGGAHYRWFAAYDATKPPALGNGAVAGDELVDSTGTKVIA